MSDIIVTWDRPTLIYEAKMARASEEELEAIENLSYGEQYVINGKRFIFIKGRDENYYTDVQDTSQQPKKA